MEENPGHYQKLRSWWARHFSRASAQLGLGEILLSPLFIWHSLANAIGWGLLIGLLLLAHGIGNLKNWKPATVFSGIIGIGLIVLGVIWAWYYGRNGRIQSASGLEQFDNFMNYIVGWGYVWILAVSGWHLVVEAKDRFWPKQTTHKLEAD